MALFSGLNMIARVRGRAATDCVEASRKENGSGRQVLEMVRWLPLLSDIHINEVKSSEHE